MANETTSGFINFWLGMAFSMKNNRDILFELNELRFEAGQCSFGIYNQFRKELINDWN